MLRLREVEMLRALNSDGWLLISTRVVRLFAYGFLSVVLVLYLAEVGLKDEQIGALLSWTLVGDAAISLVIASIADRVGRRRMLLIGAGLVVLAGLVFALTEHMLLLTLAAIVGTISPSGGEVGAFLSIEQAALPQTIPERQRTQAFAWYNLGGSFATAVGALCGGALAMGMQLEGSTPLESYRAILLGYAALGVLLALLFSRLSPAVEVSVTADGETQPLSGLLRGRVGLHRSRNVVFKLAGLFMLDSFAGGLVVQSLIAYWFHVRYGVDTATLGGIFFGANLLAGVSALLAARLAARFGLINTMVWTHIPANALLMTVPLMPTLPLAIVAYLARASISQMDVPTRQSYTMAVVAPDERSAAAGITTVVRPLGSALAPTLSGIFIGASLLSVPFFLAGALKITYDLALYRSFRALKPPEEQGRRGEC